MPGSNKIKITPPPKLESSDLTLDKLQTWYSGMRNCFKHDPDHKQFLKGQTYETWTALKTDKTRGIVIQPIDYQDPATQAANPSARSLRILLVRCVQKIRPLLSQKIRPFRLK